MTLKVLTSLQEPPLWRWYPVEHLIVTGRRQYIATLWDQGGPCNYVLVCDGVNRKHRHVEAKRIRSAVGFTRYEAAARAIHGDPDQDHPVGRPAVAFYVNTMCRIGRWGSESL